MRPRNKLKEKRRRRIVYVGNNGVVVTSTEEVRNLTILM